MKLIKVIILAGLLGLSGILFFNKMPAHALLTVISLYIIYEVLWSDHIRYNPRTDTALEFSEGTRLAAKIIDGELLVPDILQTGSYTVLLKARLNSRFSGYIFDPYIELSNKRNHIQQYFERGLSGSRYINLTNACQSASFIRITGVHCKITELDNLEIFAFKKPELRNKKTLVLSPHPDDAEIAAFGLYSSCNSMIVTITAGESGAVFYEPLVKNKFQASRLKGQLRTFDSITIPLWAGVPTERVINLGYFDGTLEAMYQNKDKNVYSLDSNIESLNFFRTLHPPQPSLPIKKEANWMGLVSDLEEIVKDFKPDYIVTPHPDHDHHSDHKFTTLAIKQALEGLDDLNSFTFLHYINHLKDTECWPFGPVGSETGLPPISGTELSSFSFPLDTEMQVRKHCALEMMHDLRQPLKFKKLLRANLQNLLIGRVSSMFGKEPFYSRSVKQSELFFLGSPNKSQKS